MSKAPEYRRLRLSDEAYEHLAKLAARADYVDPTSQRAKGLGAFIAALFSHANRVDFIDDRRAAAPHLYNVMDDPDHPDYALRIPDWGPTYDIADPVDDLRKERLITLSAATVNNIVRIGLMHMICSPNRKKEFSHYFTQLATTEVPDARETGAIVTLPSPHTENFRRRTFTTTRPGRVRTTHLTEVPETPSHTLEVVRMSVVNAVLEAIGRRYLLPTHLPHNPNPPYRRPRRAKFEMVF